MTIVETDEVNLVRNECIVRSNAYYDPFLLGSVEVTAPEANSQPSPEKCCESCAAAADACNGWQWCPLPAGCAVPGSNATFPALGCQIFSLAGFSAFTSDYDFSLVKNSGPGVPFIAGARGWVGGWVARGEQRRREESKERRRRQQQQQQP